MSDLLKAVAQPVTYERTLQVIRVPNPAAGAQWSVTVPGDQAWRVLSVAALLTTSAVAGNRSAALLADDQQSVFMGADSDVAIAANLAVTISWALGLITSTSIVTGGVASAGLPDLVLPPGYRLRSATTAFDVADQWSSIAIAVESLQTLPFGTKQETEAETFARYLAPYLQSSGA